MQQNLFACAESSKVEYEDELFTQSSAQLIAESCQDGRVALDASSAMDQVLRSGYRERVLGSLGGWE
jgi:hypothetical protein